MSQPLRDLVFVSYSHRNPVSLGDGIEATMPTLIPEMALSAAAASGSKQCVSETHGCGTRAQEAEARGFPRKSGRRFRRFSGQPGPMHDRARYGKDAPCVADGQVSGPDEVGHRHALGW